MTVIPRFWTVIPDKGGYRFGFNGQEKDDEINGVTGAWYEYGERMYMSLIGRFPSVDPIAYDYPFFSPYQYAGNDPVNAVDIDGLEPAYPKSDGNYTTARDATQRPLTDKEGIDYLNQTSSGINSESSIADNLVDFTIGFFPLDEANALITGEDAYGNEVGVFEAIANFGVASTRGGPNKSPKLSKSTSSSVETSLPKGVANPKVKESIEIGKQAHKEFSAKAKQKGWEVEPSLTDPKTGKTVKPDARLPKGNPLELKPKTPIGIKKGASQIKGQERATGLKGRVLYYDPNKYKPSGGSGGSH